MHRAGHQKKTFERNSQTHLMLESVRILRQKCDIYNQILHHVLENSGLLIIASVVVSRLLNFFALVRHDQKAYCKQRTRKINK